ncbi:MAG: DNA gyrase subunit B, partial [Thermoanaerobaculia bacterium]
MTDADVDGSHIRTLILTFFFQHMREVIQAGHLFIAQPPLFRVAQGKKDHYIKDEGDLSRFLMERVAENVSVTPADGVTLTGAPLIEMLEMMEEYRSHVRKLEARGIPVTALEVIFNAKVTDKAALTDEVKMKSLEKAIRDAGFDAVELQRDEESGVASLAFEAARNGSRRSLMVDADFLTQYEFRQAAVSWAKVVGFGRAPYALRHTSEKAVAAAVPDQILPAVDELLQTIYDLAKKGLSISRYKGLGEMNPEQLWDTTMNPETRQLLQVKIEDVIEADQMFTILMGDEVEPRREFIQNNALNVKNLDI